MKNTFIVALIAFVTPIVALSTPRSEAMPNCMVCNADAYCKSGPGGGSCIRDCSGGVCVCASNENPNC